MLNMIRMGRIVSKFIRTLYNQYSLAQIYLVKSLLILILIILSIKSNKNFGFVLFTFLKF